MRTAPAAERTLLLAMRGALSAARALPLRWSRRIGRGGGRFVAGMGSHTFEVICRNLELAFPDLDASARLALARRSAMEAGALLAEFGLVWQAPVEHALAAVRHVEGGRLLETDRGCLVLGPHVGNWEVLNHWVARRMPFTVLFDPEGPPQIMAWLRQRRARSGARLHPLGPGGLWAALAALRAGEAVGLLPDQVPSRDAGVHVPFFGAQALTMTLVQRLLRRTGARAVFAVAARVEGGFDLRFSAAEGIDVSDPEIAARALNAGIEDCVRPLLPQYLWAYKRYKRPPPGRPDPYRR